jgi:hypothetical protein
MITYLTFFLQGRVRDLWGEIRIMRDICPLRITDIVDEIFLNLPCPIRTFRPIRAALAALDDLELNK